LKRFRVPRLRVLLSRPRPSRRQSVSRSFLRLSVGAVRLALAIVVSVLTGCGDDSNSTGPSIPFGTPYDLVIPEGFPAPEIPEDNALSVEGVELGRRLFFDPILSIDSTRSCASCHRPQFAFSDQARFSRGVDGRTARNSMTLANAAWMPALFWDGRAASLEDQALQPVVDADEMGETWANVEAKLSRHPRYPTLFEAAFGPGKITADRTVKAIAQFERTLISANSRFDRYAAGTDTLTAQELLGVELFFNEIGDCFHCHGTVLLTDNQFHNNGLQATISDSGLASVTGSVYDAGKFRSPTLRNIEHTAPYMHDGRFQTLSEAIDHYDGGLQSSPTLDPLLVGRETRLTGEQKDAIIAFLLTLSDPDFLIRP
jgi:cytochrome c peroxidase